MENFLSFASGCAVKNTNRGFANGDAYLKNPIVIFSREKEIVHSFFFHLHQEPTFCFPT